MDIMMECPNCGRPAMVYNNQADFVCKDETGCAFVCEVDHLTGTLEYLEDRWVLYDTAEV